MAADIVIDEEVVTTEGMRGEEAGPVRGRGTVRGTINGVDTTGSGRLHMGEIIREDTIVAEGVTKGRDLERGSASTVSDILYFCVTSS
ncbi:hypothetical protein FOZ61_008468 [Perkinsus olseni]|uniref:Uncharacterized protein n=1 Tax=Perkinsus olseni TaxID=32597 RepID=A0A7J6L4P0_PEROL|nr:hypothetical protein FOZ61_008468 [Perkinsus olseni]